MRIIDSGLEEQAVLLVKMGEYTYETLYISIDGYLKSKSVYTEIKEMSDILVAMSNKVEDQTFQLIARFQPVASDLRAIKSHMKIANDFARYGRYALDISSINKQISGLIECDSSTVEFISDISKKVLSMVKISIDSLKNYDVELAKTITTIEREVDKMFLNFLNTLLTEQNNSRCILASALITRYLERIADHAVYVCESIVYIKTGQKISLG
jgi:phosphate transport system protein